MIKYQSKNLNKDKERIYTVWHGKRGKKWFLAEILFIYSPFSTLASIPFRISRLILEYHLSNILLVDKRSRWLRKMHLQEQTCDRGWLRITPCVNGHVLFLAILTQPMITYYFYQGVMMFREERKENKKEEKEMISVSTYLIVSLNLSSDLKNEIFSNHDITIIYFFIYSI